MDVSARNRDPGSWYDRSGHCHAACEAELDNGDENETNPVRSNHLGASPPHTRRADDGGRWIGRGSVTDCSALCACLVGSFSPALVRAGLWACNGLLTQIHLRRYRHVMAFSTLYYGAYY